MYNIIIKYIRLENKNAFKIGFRDETPSIKFVDELAGVMQLFYSTFNFLNKLYYDKRLCGCFENVVI